MVKTMARTRVLVAHEDEYRAYREVIAAGIRALRPHVMVATCTPDELARGELERFGPQVVVCGRSGIADPGDTPAWVELPPELGQPARVRVGDRRWAPTNPTLEDLLRIVDEAENLLRARADRADLRGPLGGG